MLDARESIQHDLYSKLDIEKAALKRSPSGFSLGKKSARSGKGQGTMMSGRRALENRNTAIEMYKKIDETFFD
jgi:hypothetical protein